MHSTTTPTADVSRSLAPSCVDLKSRQSPTGPLFRRAPRAAIIRVMDSERRGVPGWVWIIVVAAVLLAIWFVAGEIVTVR
jgi:hypothetical protein